MLSCLVVICWERANLLAPLYVMVSCVIVTFPCGVLGQVWYLIVSIPDLSLLTYLYRYTLTFNIWSKQRCGCSLKHVYMYICPHMYSHILRAVSYIFKYHKTVIINVIALSWLKWASMLQIHVVVSPLGPDKQLLDRSWINLSTNGFRYSWYKVCCSSPYVLWLRVWLFVSFFICNQFTEAFLSKVWFSDTCFYSYLAYTRGS